MSRVSAPTSIRSVDQKPLASPNTGDNSSAQGTVLRGANIAFKGSPSPARPLVNTYSGTNGALAAATKAGLSSPRLPEDRRTPDQKHSLKASQDVMTRKHSGAFNSVDVVSPAHASLRLSPSHIAATRAAARATPAPLSRENTGKQQARARSILSLADSQEGEESIPPTNKLVEMFESKQRLREENVEVKARSATRIVSPIPIRPPVSFLPAKTSSPSPLEAARTFPPKKRANLSNHAAKGPTAAAVLPAKSLSLATTAPSPPSRSSRMSLKGPKVSKTISISRPEPPAFPSSSQMDASEKPKVAPAVPPPRRTKSILDTTPPLPIRRTTVAGNDSDTESTGSFASARDTFSPTSTISRANTLTRTQSRGSGLTRSNTLLNHKPVLPPPKPTSLQLSIPGHSSEVPVPILPPRRPSSSLSRTRATHSPYLKPQLTADSLANAMVGASLASSRVPSPSKSRPPLPPPRQSSKSHSLAFLHPSPTVSRAPSPLKSMRQTLRPAPSSSEDDDRKSPDHHHHHILKRKHPNKHAEGDRKRWRDAVTEAERKRYEGVWAANRGASVPVPGTGPDEVHGLVVKDIWSRSGLEALILEKIWDLVVDSGKGNGRSERRVLGKDEFVVGIWLVDQCLKGRKLPVQVGESVWASVRRLTSGMRTR